MDLFERRRCPDCDDVLPVDARACQCGWRERPVSKRRNGEPEINLNCAWHSGCGLRGSMSDCTNGAGPWYCSEHYWLLKGQKPQLNPPVSYRNRWGEDHKKKPEDPPIGNVADYAPAIREPGQDDEEQAA